MRGNRWVGIVSLADPSAPVPLHVLARENDQRLDRFDLKQHQTMLRRPNAHLIVLPGGGRVWRKEAREVLTRTGHELAVASQWNKSEVCYEVARILVNQDLPEDAWPGWLLRRLLAAFEPASPPPRRKRPSRSTQVPTPARTGYTLPALPQALDAIPVAPQLLSVLSRLGWEPEAGRPSLAWLRLALIHRSYRFDHDAIRDETSPGLFKLLADLGRDWVRVAALDVQLATDPTQDVTEHTTKLATRCRVLPGALAEILSTDASGVYGVGQLSPTPKDTEEIALQICGALVLLDKFVVLERLVQEAWHRSAGGNIADHRRVSPTPPPSRLRHPPTGHTEAVVALRRTFGLPPSADPWITQALCHVTFAHQHRDALARAGQRDNRLLAYQGLAIMGAMRSLHLAVSVINRTRTPAAEQVRFGTASDRSMYMLFDALDLRASVLLGTKQKSRNLTAVKVVTVQALYAVAWREVRDNLLHHLPTATLIWFDEYEAPDDTYTQLVRMCKTSAITITSEEKRTRPDRSPIYKSTITMRRDGQTVQYSGPARHGGKITARAAAASEVLDALLANADAERLGEVDPHPIVSFLLSAHIDAAGHIRGVGQVRAARVLGVEHLLTGDAGRFGAWASACEKTVGSVSDATAAGLYTLYTGALKQLRTPALRALRSRARQSASGVVAALASGSAARVEDLPGWVELVACAAALAASAAPVGTTLTTVLRTWAEEGVPGAAHASVTAAKALPKHSLAPKDATMIQAVGGAWLAAALAARTNPEVSFSDNGSVAVLTIDAPNLDPMTSIPELLDIAVTVSPALSWVAAPGQLSVHVGVSSGKIDELSGIAGAGISAMWAPSADAEKTGRQLAFVMKQLVDAAGAETASRAAIFARMGPDPLTWIADG